MAEWTCSGLVCTLAWFATARGGLLLVLRIPFHLHLCSCVIKCFISGILTLDLRWLKTSLDRSILLYSSSNSKKFEKFTKKYFTKIFSFLAREKVWYLEFSFSQIHLLGKYITIILNTTQFILLPSYFYTYLSKFNPMTPCVHKMVKHTLKVLHLLIL